MQAPSAHTSLCGLGIGVGVRDDGYTNWSHAGAFLLGTGTTVGMIPEHQLGVVVITNGQPVGAAEAMTYIGSYGNSHYGPLQVSELRPRDEPR